MSQNKQFHPFISALEVPGLLKEFKKVQNKPKVDKIDISHHKKLCTDIGDLEGITTYSNLPFENWGQTVMNTPCLTCYPQSIKDIQRIVNWSRLHGKRVRCSGYRHTWVSAYSGNDEVLIIMIPIAESSSPPDDYKHNPNNDLCHIELITNSDGKSECEDSKSPPLLIKVGASVSNDQLRKWSIQNNVCIPSNVITAQITLGGSNAPICHGSGINEQTLSDLVYEMEIVNAKGEIVKFSRQTHSADEMNVVCGSFGLFGVTVSLTLRAEPMSYAELNLLFEPNHIAVPPVNVTSGIAYDKFRERIVKMDYNEFLWFPFQEDTYINCWYKTTDPTGVVDYPSSMDCRLQEVEELISGIMDTTVFKFLSPIKRGQIFGDVIRHVIPQHNHGGKVKTYLPNAQHFRRGIHNKKVRNFEMEVPLEESKTYRNEPDLTPVQGIWNDLIKLVNLLKEQGQAPMLVTIEMRVMGGSNIIMAPQYGNKYTLAIEILSDMSISHEEWISFCDLTMPIFDAYTSFPARPHWAKEWEPVSKQGHRGLDWIKPLYMAQIRAFKDCHKLLGTDPYHMFSNNLFDRLFEFNFNPIKYPLLYDNHITDEPPSTCFSCFKYCIGRVCCISKT
jgi:hypothetical protein